MCLVAATASPALAQPSRPAPAAQTVSAAELRLIGFRAIAAGDRNAAAQIAAALLARDPSDGSALILQARAARDGGDYQTARAAARTAWAGAQTDAERYGAALAMAQALASDGRRTGAQFWLRRAVEHAPNPRARSIAIRDFGYVRSRNPLRLSFDLAIAPSSNVNNGSRHDRLEGFGLIGTLSPDAQALSGWAAQAGAAARLRIGETESTRTDLRLSVVRRQVTLSSGAKDKIETYRRDQLALGSIVNPQTNFNYAAVELGLSQMRRQDWGTLHLGATLGHNWYGGRDLSDYARLDIGAERPLSPQRLIHGGIAVERQWRRDNPLRNADIVSLSAGVVQGLASGDRLRLSFGARQAASVSADVRHEAFSARLGWDRGAPVAGMRLSASLLAEARRYDASLLAPAGRRDLRLEAEVSMVFERIDYMGFSPTLDLRASRAGSNVAPFDGRDFGIALGFRSSF